LTVERKEIRFVKAKRAQKGAMGLGTKGGKRSTTGAGGTQPSARKVKAEKTKNHIFKRKRAVYRTKRARFVNPMIRPFRKKRKKKTPKGLKKRPKGHKGTKSGNERNPIFWVPGEESEKTGNKTILIRVPAESRGGADTRPL